MERVRRQKRVGHDFLERRADLRFVTSLWGGTFETLAARKQSINMEEKKNRIAGHTTSGSNSEGNTPKMRQPDAFSIRLNLGDGGACPPDRKIIRYNTTRTSRVSVYTPFFCCRRKPQRPGCLCCEGRQLCPSPRPVRRNRRPSSSCARNEPIQKRKGQFCFDTACFEFCPASAGASFCLS